jgi:tetratricopeptide (TPR) repeat protein
MLFAVILALISAGQTAAPQNTADRQAAALIEKGDLDDAISLLQQAVATSPNDVSIRNLLGIALSRKGREETAMEEFRKAVELDPHSLPSLEDLALSELALGRRKQAQAHFEAIIKAAPRDAQAHASLGEIAFGDGRYAAALAHFKQSGDLYLKVPTYTIEYSRACVELNQADSAISALKKFPDSADPAAHLQAGVLLAGLGQFESAAGHFRRAMDGLPNPYDAGYNLVLAWSKSNHPDRAVEVGDELIRRGYRKPELYNLLSQAYEQSGRTKEAYGALRTATELDPTDETNYLDLMALCLDHQNWDLSLEIASIGLSKIPGSYRLHLHRGAVMAMRTQYEDAAKDFTAAVHAAPDKALPYVALALVKMQTNSNDEAIEILRERRKAAAPDYLTGWFLGEALNRTGVTPGTPGEEEAVAALRQAIQLNPRAEQARVLLGRFLLKRGDADGAIEQLTRALQLDPTDSSAVYQLAQAYRKRGDAARASELFAKVSKEKAEAREQFNQRNLVRIIREASP